MKVLMLSTDTHVFAEGSGVRNRMLSYARSCKELHILVLASGAGEATEQIAENAWVYSTRSLLKPLALLDALRIGKGIGKEHALDVVSAQDPFEIGWVGKRLAQKLGCALHVQVHTDMGNPRFVGDNWKNAWRVRIASGVLKAAGGIRVVSERIKKNLVATYGERIVEPAVLPIIGSAVPQIEGEKPPFMFTIVVVGRLTSEKHVFTALDVLAEVQKSYRKAGMVFVGSGPLHDDVIRHAQELGVRQFVKCVGHVEQVGAWYTRAHCFLHTAAFEGYGRVFVEAALYRVPMVVTDVGIIGEVFDPACDVFACPVDDVACLTKGVTSILNDTHTREVLKRNAYTKAMRHISQYTHYASRVMDNIAESV